MSDEKCGFSKVVHACVVNVYLISLFTLFPAKELEEKVLREQCEVLAREAEKAQERKRRQLIEKSYSVNLADPTTT